MKHSFDAVRVAGITLPHVEATTRYDGSPVLKLAGCFLAGLAPHPSAEPETLVIRATFDERASMIEDAPRTYYLTEYYRPYPLVLVRLSQVDGDSLRELLAMSWRLTLPKTGRRERARHHGVTR